MRAYYGSPISANRTTTPEGYLVCLNVPIARTGTQQYLRGELGLDGDPNEIVNVFRPEAEVFAAATIASFEGKTVTNEHPPVGVTIENITAFDCGHVQNVRRGQGEESDLLIADLFITSRALIDEIERGMREVSCGYDCEYALGDDGQIFQRSIRGNHVAVVPAGRAGSRVAIKDSASESDNQPKERRKIMTKKNQSLIARIFSRAVKDMEPDEIAEAIDEMASAPAEAGTDTAPAAPAEPVKAPSDGDCKTSDNGEALNQILSAITALGEQIKALAAPHDAEPEQPDPLDALAAEIAKSQQEETPADQEASETIPADEMPEATADEEGPVAPASTLPENPIPGADRAVVLATINAIKPLIASLPAADRKAASDKAASVIRQAMNKDTKAKKAGGYNGIVSVMQRQGKSAKDATPARDNGEIGRKIMASRNPHYKAKA